MRPVIALLTAGVEMDVLGLGFSAVSDKLREEAVAAHPRGEHFKESILQAFNNGIKDRPETTFGNVKADVLEKFDPNFKRMNFCEINLNSAWPS